MATRRVIRVPAAFSPLIAFPALWVVGVLIAQIKLLDLQGGWSIMAWVVMAAVPLSFVAGAHLARRLVKKRLASLARVASGPAASSPRLRLLLFGLVGLGILETIHQFLGAGFVPALATNIDEARTSLPGGPTILLLDGLTVAAVIALSVPQKLLSRHAMPELLIAAASLGVIASYGGRGPVVIPLAVAFLARWMVHGRPPARAIVLGGLALAGVFSLAFYIRTAQPPTDNFDSELYGSVVPGTASLLLPLLPIHFAFAMNFEVLAHVVDYFPSDRPFGGGSYNAVALDAVIGNTQPLSDVTARITSPWVTSTLAGPLWADGGLILVVIAVMLVGAASEASHALLRRTLEFRHALLFAYVLYLTLFGIYQNYWTQYIDWLLVAPGLVLLGAIATNPQHPPGVTGRLFDLWRTQRRGAWVKDRVRGGGRLAASVRERSKLAATRSPLGKRPGWQALAALVAGVVIVGATITAISASTNSSVKKVHPGGRGAQALVVSTRTPLPPAGETAGQPVVTDGDAPEDNAPLFFIREHAPQISVLRLTPLSGGRLSPRALTLPVQPAPGSRYDVTRWDGTGDTLMALGSRPRSVRVTGYSLVDPGRIQVQGTARLSAPRPQATRSFAVATWSGSRPDLFVFDRGSKIDRMIIRIFSGESNFSRAVVVARAPLRGLASSAWTIDAGFAEGRRPEVVMVRRKGTKRRAEAHVLQGETKFQQFLTQRQMRVPTGLPPSYRFRFGVSLGRAAIFGVDQRRPPGRLEIVPLFPFEARSR